MIDSEHYFTLFLYGKQARSLAFHHLSYFHKSRVHLTMQGVDQVVSLGFAVLWCIEIPQGGSHLFQC